MSLRLTRLVVAVVIGIVVAAGSITVLSTREPARCLSLGPNDSTVIHACRLRPKWASHAGLLLAVAGAAAVSGIALGWGIVAVAGGIGAAAGLISGLGNLFIRWWAPPATPSNASPPAEAFYYLGGALVAVAITGVFLWAVLFVQTRRPSTGVKGHS